MDHVDYLYGFKPELILKTGRNLWTVKIKTSINSQPFIAE